MAQATHQGCAVVVADGQRAGVIDQEVVGEAHVLVVVHDGSQQRSHHRETVGKLGHHGATAYDHMQRLHEVA
eukprot:1160780-Pelagomonas_calceolata.AAC.12